ncbi:uncharacterized protein LOC120337591 isoform X1 [Styela clava]
MFWLNFFICIIMLCLISKQQSRACKNRCACKCAAEVSDCSNMGLTTIPESIESETKEINLSGNRLDQVTEKTISSMIFDTTSIEIIDLSNNSLKEIPKSAFKMTTSLRKLILDDNKIYLFPEEALSKFNNTLERLSIRNNNLNSMDFIQRFSALKRVDLTGNCLGTFNNIKNVNLLEFKIGKQNSGCPLTFPDFSLSNMKSLINFEMAGNTDGNTLISASFLSKLPTNLTRLSVSYVSGANILLTNTMIEELYLVNVYNSELIDISSLCNTGLKVYMKNAIMKFEEFNKFPESCRCQQMYIENSSVIFETTWEKLHKLTNLSLIDCDLSSLPTNSRYKSINVITSLMFLNLSKNRIYEWSDSFFTSLQSLQTLDMRSNQILHFNGTSLGNVTSLVELYLAHNKISSLNGNLNLEQLQYLSLAWNNITYIPKDFFQFCRSLGLVDFTHNKLRSVGMFSTIQVEQLVILADHNQWNCGNNMKTHYQQILEHKHVDLECAYHYYQTNVTILKNLTKADYGKKFYNDSTLCFICDTPKIYAGMTAEKVVAFDIASANTSSVSSTSTNFTASSTLATNTESTIPSEYELIMYYVYIGAGVGGFMLITILIITLICWCKIRRTKDKSRNNISASDNLDRPKEFSDPVGNYLDHTYASVVSRKRNESDIPLPPPVNSSVFARLKASMFRRNIASRERPEGPYEVPIGPEPDFQQSTRNPTHDEGYMSFNEHTNASEINNSGSEIDESGNIRRSTPLTSSLYLIPIKSSRVSTGMSVMLEEENSYENI